MRYKIQILLLLAITLVGPASAAEPRAAAAPAGKQKGTVERKAEGQAPAAPSSGVKLDTEDQKTVYALGLLLAASVEQYNLSPEELELFKAGVTDGVLKRTPQVELKEYQPKLQPWAQTRASQIAEAEEKASEDLLQKMAKQKGAVKTESGLILITEKAGVGDSPNATDTVKVHYQGTLRDGTLFDSSLERGIPATFPLNQVIPCWTEGLQKMKVGGKAKLICPSSIAYGDVGKLKIKPGAALTFDVELIEIVKAATPSDQPAGHLLFGK